MAKANLSTGAGSNGNDPIGWKLFALAIPVCFGLLMAMLAGLRSDLQAQGGQIMSHEKLDGHPGTMAEIRALRRELEDFRSEFRDYTRKKNP